MQRSAAVILISTFLGACGDDASASTGGGGGAAGTGATTAAGETTGATGGGGPGGGGGDVTPPPKSELAEGWEKAFAAEPVAIACDASALASGAPTLSIGGSTIVVGYEQVGESQDPVVARFDGETLAWCERHEQEPPDGRAVGLAWNGGDKAHLLFTIAGGGSRFDDVAQGGWIETHGDGGASAEVGFVAELATTTGNLVRGTFILARNQDGDTNTFTPTDAPIRRADALLEIHGDSAFQPLNPDGTIMECADSPFFTKYVLSADLSQVECAVSTSCVGATPCEP